MMDIQKLLEIMAKLRDPESGCPWDRRQSFETIAPYTIEEAYEVADAIQRGAHDELADELGDLLFQVVYHARMAEEIGAFDFGDVTRRICEKLLRRHPQVFGEPGAAAAAAEAGDWEALKSAEKRVKRAAASGGAEPGLLDDVPKGLPGLTRAVKLGRLASQVGFDWPRLEPVRAKLDEELAELDAAIEAGDREICGAEIGDVLFAVANLCRHLRLDPEACLRGTNRRFERRFGHVEAAVKERGGDWSAFDLDRLDGFWEAAKRAERTDSGRRHSQGIDNDR